MASLQVLSCGGAMFASMKYASDVPTQKLPWTTWPPKRHRNPNRRARTDLVISCQVEVTALTPWNPSCLTRRRSSQQKELFGTGRAAKPFPLHPSRATRRFLDPTAKSTKCFTQGMMLGRSRRPGPCLKIVGRRTSLRTVVVHLQSEVGRSPSKASQTLLLSCGIWQLHSTQFVHYSSKRCRQHVQRHLVATWHGLHSLEVQPAASTLPNPI
mmetsp:Transcript_83735/g.233530  ORF Transcript_83735/g.233530 Transcript_83735/m.233530 type:complete len:212 (+) Transcript_83735:558-1193(+)